MFSVFCVRKTHQLRHQEEPAASAAAVRRTSLRGYGATIASSQRCEGVYTATRLARDLLIDPLRQPGRPRLLNESRGSLPKNFDTQRERHLQPLVDGIGGEYTTCCNEIRDEPNFEWLRRNPPAPPA